MKTDAGTNGNATRGQTPGQAGQRALGAAIEKLYQQANVLSYAMQGVLLMAESSEPVISWEDELRPLEDLTMQVAVLARDVYLEVDQEAAKQAGERKWQYGVLMQALSERWKREEEAKAAA